MRWRLRPTLVMFTSFAVTFALYLYVTVDRKLFLLHLNQSISTYSRAQNWNWNSTPEEVLCRTGQDLHGKSPIPNVVHFVLLSNEGERFELSYAQFLAIKAVLVRMNPSELQIHAFELDTENQWWKEIQHHVTLVHLDRHEILSPNRYALSDLALAHQADVIRLEILMREGGIYLDTDVYVFKPFSDVLNNPQDTVMGHEGANRYGLCNAVIITRPGSDFIQLWRERYQTFDHRKWNVHSVMVPKQIQVKYPDLVCPLAPTVFFWPFWEIWNVKYMHEPISAAGIEDLRANMTAYGGSMYADQLAYHSWGGRDYLRNLTPALVATRDTRFNLLVRDIATAPLP